MGLFSLLKKIFGSKKEEVEVIRHKSPTEFLRHVEVTSVEQEFKPAKSGKIILYEDSVTFSSAVKKELEKEGFQVTVFDNASNVLDNIKSIKPDLILMDINLPRMSGLEATRKIKSKVANKDLPVVILTSANTPQAHLESMKVGARTFLTKDQSMDDIICAIKAYMTNTAFKSDISQVIQINKLLK